MATWRAKCWLGSANGYQDLEVQSNTYYGAEEQLQRIYGAEQIINLREVSSSSYSSGSFGISWGLIGAFFGIVLAIQYWSIVFPIGIILGILCIIGWLADDD